MMPVKTIKMKEVMNNVMIFENIPLMLSSVIMQISFNGLDLEPTDLVDLATGIFAVFLLGLSLLAYRNTRTKRLLFVSTAFGLFALRTIISRLDFFIPEAQSTVIELVLALTGFAILSLFFLAIVKKS